jgi:hypothetical protein
MVMQGQAWTVAPASTQVRLSGVITREMPKIKEYQEITI